MDKLVINGSKRLTGEIEVHGSKNSVLPILAACVLSQGENIIHNCPILSDVDAALKILVELGCKVKREEHTVCVDSSGVNGFEISDSLMREMRSSVIFLGAILGRTGKAVLSTPGGCEIGLRPIDMHISAMEQLGAEVFEEHGRLHFECKNGLHGARVILPFPSVGATENIMIASCVAKGTTVITNAAREPEISDLADFLNGCGAKIHGAGDSTITIDGVEKLTATTHTVIPDRIAASTYLLAGAITHGRVCIKEIIPAHLGALIPVLKQSGCDISVSNRWICISSPPRLSRVKTVRTMPYPGFPTDVQAPLTAMLSVADGTSVVVENIFECRYKHVSELIRLGAKINVEGRTAVIEGVPYLTGASVVSPDLRGGFALVIAGLAAKGETVISGVEHIDRGYENPEKLLSALGADVKRIKENGTEKK
jgi:UDP-N-acetylglucosamine 1-carboxyvinyltransferase